MTAPAERMKAMRDRRRALGLREVRLMLPDSRAAAIRHRVAQQVAKLDPAQENAASRWIEAVSEFDGPDAPNRDKAPTTRRAAVKRQPPLRPA